MWWHTSRQSEKHLLVHLMALLGSLKSHAKLRAVKFCSTQWSDKCFTSDYYRTINVVRVFIWHLFIQCGVDFQNQWVMQICPLSFVKIQPCCICVCLSFALVGLSELCTLCYCFFKPTAPKPELSGWKSDLRCRKTRYIQLLILPPTPYFSLYGFYSPFSFSIRSLCVFPHLPRTAAAPPPLPSPALSLPLFSSFVFNLRRVLTSHSLLSPSLSLLTCWPHSFPFSFYLSLILPHFLFPLVFNQPSGLPLLALWLFHFPMIEPGAGIKWPASLLSPGLRARAVKESFVPQTLHRLWRYVLCCPYRKGLWSDWNFWGPWENVSELGP